MTQYKIRKDEEGNDLLFKIEESGKEWSVPMIEGNSDYAAYLNLEAALSTPIVSSDE